MSTSVLLKICVLSALTCMCRITFTCASFTSSTPSLQSIDFGSNATKGISTKNADGEGVLLENSTIKANTTTSVDRKPFYGIVDSVLQTRKRSAKSLLSAEFTMDKFVGFVTASNNLINSHTNYPKLDKLTKSFSSLYNSDGSIAVLNFWEMWVNVWTVIDAVANVFRAYETRVLNAIDENQPPPPNPLEDLQQSLDDANNNIAVVSDLFQQLARMGEFDDDSAEQEDGDDSETQVVQTRMRRLLQDESEEKQEDRNDSKTHGHENHEEYGKEDQVRPAKKDVKILHKDKQDLIMETDRHGYRSVGYSSNSAVNPQKHRSLAEASDYSNPVTRSRRDKPFIVDMKSCKKKSNKKSLTIEPASDVTSKHSTNISSDRTKSVGVKHNGKRNKRSNLRFNFGVDKFIYFMAKANNVLNSNTNNRQLNRFTRAFNDLFDSDGLTAFNTFYTLLASFWTIVDAVANVFRFNEARIRDQIQQQQEAAQPDPLGDLQEELDGTNANLAEVADLVSALQNGAAARLDTVSAKPHNGFSRHHVHHKKKTHHSRPTHAGNKHLVHPTPSPRRAIPSAGNQESHKNHSTSTWKSISVSPVTTNPHTHFASGGWKPVTESPYPSVETNRGFYHPVSYDNNQFRDGRHNPQSISTVNHAFKPVQGGRSNSDTVHRVSHQHSGYASDHRSPNVPAGGSGNYRSSFEPIATTSHHRARTYGSRIGRHSKVNQGYGESSAIFKSANN